MLDEEFEVLYEVLLYPSINVNKLYQSLSGKISKVKLIALIKRLSDLGLIRTVRDPRHKQRIMLFLREDIQALAQRFLIEPINDKGRDVVKEAERLIRSYMEVASSVRDPVAKEFLKKLVTVEVDRLLSLVM
jgi:DNA-binding MarR family transcriptional regulator